MRGDNAKGQGKVTCEHTLTAMGNSSSLSVGEMLLISPKPIPAVGVVFFLCSLAWSLQTW